jgi:hypothetical protein
MSMRNCWKNNITEHLRYLLVQCVQSIPEDKRSAQVEAVICVTEAMDPGTRAR